MNLDFQLSEKWYPKGHVIECIDAHTEGEPLRVILSGFPQPEGDTILARRKNLKDSFDSFRTALMWEPRGHADMYGCLLTEPISNDADFGVLFLHNDGYSTMCGHGIIAVVKVVLETGILPIIAPETCVTIDTPAGRVTAFALIEDGHVQSVRFHNVPSYAHALDQSVDVPELGIVPYDLAYGGAYYAFVHASDLELVTDPSHTKDLVHSGMLIKETITENTTIDHPFEPDVSFLYGVIFIGTAESPDAHTRHVCIFADGEVDRSPTGTGVSGRLALLHARDHLEIGQSVRIESIIGSSFTGQVIEECTFGPHQAIIPEITGTAFITGHHTFLLDATDPYQHGFLVRSS
ncbi:MAG: proline racemase family protein [Bacteroidetes bacterium]|nr:proline racemase family protein [Bacteroidota bacterium]